MSLCSPRSLWSKPFILRSVITGLVPGFPFRVELVHINLEVLRHRWTDWVAYTRELAQGRIGSRSVGPLRLTCVGWAACGGGGGEDKFPGSGIWVRQNPGCVGLDPVNHGSS